MLGRIWAVLRGGLMDWRTTAPGIALLAAVAFAHWLGPDGLNRLTAEVNAVGELLMALNGALGVVPGLIGAGLLIWNSKKDRSDGRS